MNGEHLQEVKHLSTSHPDQLSLANPPWVNTASTSERSDAKQAHCITH